jgi:hypothetical protein
MINQCELSPLFSLIPGGATIATAFFAEAIGLDHDPGWEEGAL